jgi:hypothetical protein
MDLHTVLSLEHSCPLGRAVLGESEYKILFHVYFDVSHKSTEDGV